MWPWVTSTADNPGYATVCNRGASGVETEWILFLNSDVLVAPDTLGMVLAEVAGDPTIGFAMPVYAIQDDAGSSQAIGLIVGLKVVGRDLYDRLRQPGEIVESGRQSGLGLAVDHVSCCRHRHLDRGSLRARRHRGAHDEPERSPGVGRRKPCVEHQL